MTKEELAVQPDPRVEALLGAIRSRGVVTDDLRDAAHEACHALRWGVHGPWTRDAIHVKKPKPHRIFGRTPEVREEIHARAVEQVVCAALGVDCGSVEKWAMVCWMEQLKNEGISLPMGDWLEKQIREAMASKEVRATADRVLALKPERPKTPKPRRKRG